MRIAILGTDEVTLHLARELCAEDRHALVLCVAPAGYKAEIARDFPLAKTSENWEDALADENLTWIIVGGETASRSERLKRLLELGKRLIVRFPVVENFLECYELQLTLEEYQGRLIPLLPLRNHPAVEQIRRPFLLASPDAGNPMETLILERHLPHFGDDLVLGCFGGDMDLARSLVGEITRVSAVGGGAANDRFANLGLQAIAANGTIIRWTTILSGGPSRLKLVAKSKAGSLEAELPMQLAGLAVGPVTLHGTGAYQALSKEFPAWTATGSIQQNLESPRPDCATLIDAARGQELTDAMKRSLQRGKTIELRYDDRSEEQNFKGVMSALGCGVLLFAMFAWIASSILAKMGLTWFGYAVYPILAVLGGFLILQFLQVLVPKGDKRKP